MKDDLDAIKVLYMLLSIDRGRGELGPGLAFFTATLLELPNMMFWRKFILMIVEKFGDWRVILLIKQRHT